MSTELELFYWWFYDATNGERRRTAYAMDRQTAEQLHGNVQADEPTRVVRTVYRCGEAPPTLEAPPQLQEPGIAR